MATKQINTDNVGIIQTQNKEQVKKLYFQNNNSKELIYWYRSNARIFISSETIKKIGVDLTLDSQYASVNIERYTKDFYTQEETTGNIKGTIKYSTSEYSYNNKKYRKLSEIAIFTGNTYRFTPVMKNYNDNTQFVVLKASNFGNENYKVDIFNNFQMTMGVIRNTLVNDSNNPDINIFFEEADLTKEYFEVDVQADEYYGLDENGIELYVGTKSFNIGKYRKNVILEADTINEDYQRYSSIHYDYETGIANIKLVCSLKGYTPRGQIIYNSYGNN